MSTTADTVVINLDQNALAAVIGGIVTLGAVALVLGVILGLLWYVLEAIGLYKMSKNRDIEPAWLAWIPIGQNYLIGELIGNEV